MHKCLSLILINTFSIDKRKEEFGVIFLLVFAMFFFKPTINAQSTITSDNGDNTFTNPLINLDFPDPDIIRVGDDYYMASSTFTTFPGVPIAHSKDLVNWEIIGYTYDSLPSIRSYHIEEGKAMYRWGSWAPCIRYNKGKFYVFFNVEFDGFYIASSTKPEGPYTIKKLGQTLYDPSVLFDEDGRIYACYGSNTIMIAEFDTNLNKLITEPTPVFVGNCGTNFEGSHIYKRDGWYYICNTARGYNGMQLCMRSKNIYGPYESRVISTDDMNYADAGLHQGGFIDTKEGETFFFMFQDRDYVGRVPVLQPVIWKDGFTYIGSKQGRALTTVKKPNIPIVGKSIENNFVGSDEFNDEKLALKWHWNHLPDNSKWSLTKKKGYLAITASHSPNFMYAQNSLMQRIVGGGSVATTRMDLSDLQVNDVAGLAVANLPYAGIGIQQNVGSQTLLMFENGETVEKAPIQNVKEIYLQIEATPEGTAKFSYSFEGKKYIPLGKEFIMEFTVKTFLGNRLAMFCYNTGVAKTGTAYFDWFHLNINQPIGSHVNAFKPISVCNYDSENGAFEYRYILKRPMQFMDQVRNNNWLGFNNIHFDEAATSFQIKAIPLEGGIIELHEDSVDGKLLGTCKIDGMAGADYTTYQCQLSIKKGKHALYLVFKGGYGSLFKLDSFSFSPQRL